MFLVWSRQVGSKGILIMSMQDPIADMPTRIRNGQVRSKFEVQMPASSKKTAVARVLKEEGYISDFRLEGEAPKEQLVLALKYYQGEPVIEKIQRVSRPGLRVYRNKDNLPSIIGGLGVAVISTSKGMMSDRQARNLGIGGEVICAVY